MPSRKKRAAHCNPYVIASPMIRYRHTRTKPDGSAGLRKKLGSAGGVETSAAVDSSASVRGESFMRNSPRQGIVAVDPRSKDQDSIRRASARLTSELGTRPFRIRFTLVPRRRVDSSEGKPGDTGRSITVVIDLTGYCGRGYAPALQLFPLAEASLNGTI